MRESPSILRYSFREIGAVTKRGVRIIRRKGRSGFGRKEVVDLNHLLSGTRENVAWSKWEKVITGYNHQLPTTVARRVTKQNRFGILRDCTPDSERNFRMKIQSGLHGDMQRVAETSTPLRSENRAKAQQNRAKFLVG